VQYPIVVHKELDSDYGVIVPDIPGCFSAGSSMEEALENAKEAIACHIEGLLMDDESIPTSLLIEKHLHNPEYQGGIWAMVDVDISQLTGKAKRVNITLPERILRQIDNFAKSHRLKNRSAFLAEAALDYIAHHR
jgi:predicted RNase H-like HicB family nuclease